MNHQDKLRLLIVTASCDADDVGETWNAYKWITELAKVCDVTVLTQQRKNRRPPSQQLALIRTIEWPELGWFHRFERFNSAAKPGYVHFYYRARRHIRELLETGSQFDVMHQLTPIAIRYPTPCRGWGIPYVVGPLSGGVSTPLAFKSECRTEPWYVRLRNVDQLRVRHDPALRRTYEYAAAILGAAPYIRDILSPVNVRRFEVECEVGIDAVVNPSPRRHRKDGELRLLYVGRVVRTKGLRDAVRAMGRLRDLPHVSLVAAGAGEDLDICRREAGMLNVSDRIEFLGRVPRDRVERLYTEADAFLFPSFREPTGGVILEAMRHGLPVITTDIGGPGHIVTDASGIRVPVRDPDQFAGDLAAAIRRIATDHLLLESMGAGARLRVAEIGLWEGKIERMMSLYRSILAPVPPPAGVDACAATEG